MSLNAVLIVALALASAPVPGGSTSLQQLVERIPEVVDDSGGIGADAQELASRMARRRFRTSSRCSGRNRSPFVTSRATSCVTSKG
ncbi:hypothetical protein [Myxococcus xanthus]|uniref:hypothetical protein n=1 Tax=Myxococcus xanthus TaxID=34 RepID=UPI0020A26EF9|nr:hypothetical protein [Myxococcus xanthus]